MEWRHVSRESSEHAGVYRVDLDGRLAYIGQSQNVVKRLATHGLFPGFICQRLGMFKGVRFTSCVLTSVAVPDVADRLCVERLLIEELGPPLCVSMNYKNRTIPPLLRPRVLLL